MCQFCVEHGEGERWYLQAKNYAYDLDSDLKRREYILDFISGFADMRSGALTWMRRAERVPAPIARAGKAAVSKYMRTHHFGQPVPLEECEQIFDLATSITVIPCICRMHTPGKRAEEVCILVTTQPIAPLVAEGFASYADGPDLDDFHRVSKGEGMTLLRECETRGLMHSVWTFETPFAAAICNCDLESGCMAMNLNSAHGLKTMWRGEWVVQLDSELCNRCGACAQVCPFSAIEASRESVVARAEQCWGCGICRASCRQDALSIVDRRAVPAVATLW